MSELRQYIGEKGEATAKEFLIGKGYVWIESNFRTRGGEIDLIMQDGRTLVFIEVKRRRSDEFGLPEEAITRSKIAHMTKTALLYLKAKGIQDKMVRFDVVTIDTNGIRHHPDAFQVTGNYYY